MVKLSNELGHNLRAPYTQRVKMLKLKPRTLVLAFHENGKIIDELSNYTKGVKVVLPTTLRNPGILFYSKYISLFTPQQKQNMFVSSSILSSSRTCILDGNFFMYRYHDMLFSEIIKSNKKYVNYADHVFNKTFDPNVFRKMGYKNVALNYIIDISKLESKISKTEIRKMFLGALEIMFNVKDYVMNAEQIILTLKTKKGYVNVLIYLKDKYNFNINRILALINAYIMSENDKVQIDDKVSKVSTRFSKIIEHKIQDPQLKDYTLNVINNYIHTHPDEPIKIDMNYVKQALVEELEDSEITVTKPTDLNYLVEKLRKNKPPSILYESKDNDFNYAFNEDKQLGSAFNFRKATSKNHLLGQIKGFNSYFEEMYKIKITNISVKKAKSKSIYRDNNQLITIRFKDESNKEFDIPFILPEGMINGDPYVNIEGTKRTLLHQLYQDPLMSVKPFETVFKTNYSAISFKSDFKSKHRGIFVYAQGKKIPFLEFMLIGKSQELKDSKGDQFAELLIASGIKKSEFSISDELPKGAHFKDYIKLGDKYYVLSKNAENRTIQIFWSFIISHRKDEFKNIQDILKLIETNYAASYINSIKQQNKHMIDPTVKYLLSQDAKSTNVFDTYNDAVDMCVTGAVTVQTDLNNRRLRSSESLSVAIFKKINPALNQYHKTNGAQAPKIKSDAIIQELLTGSLQTQFQTVQSQNPLSEIAYLSKVTYSGLNGVTPENASVDLRTVNDSFYGIIDPIDTPDSKAVGVTRHLAVSADIEKMNGKMKINSTNDDLNPLSIISNFSPFPVHNDGNRLQFASSQMKSVISMKSAEMPYVSSSYATVPINLASNAFVKKSEYAGEVVDVNDNYIIIKNKGKSKLIYFDKYSFNTSNTLSTLTPIVKIGDEITEGQPIAAAQEFFELNNLKLGLNGYTVIKPHRNMNFEDGIIISNSFAHRNTSVHGYEFTAMIEEGDTIYDLKKIGDVVAKGDVLLSRSSTVALNESLNEFDGVSVFMESESDSSDGFDSQIDFGDSDNSGDSDEDGEYEDEFNSAFDKRIKSKASGEIVDIEIFAKSEEHLKKYNELYEMHKNKIIRLEEKYKALADQKIDLSELQNKISIAKDIYGKKYRGNSIENILIIFKIKAEKALDVGDKLHNRHGKRVAA